MDLPTLGRPTTATTGGGAAASSIASATLRAELPVAFVGPGAVAHRRRPCTLRAPDPADARSPRVRSCHWCRPPARRRRPAAATPPGWSPDGHGAARRPARPRSRRAGPPATFWSLRRRARSSADAVRKIFTSASGSTTVPMSRPSTTTLPGPRPVTLQLDQSRAHRGNRRHRRHRLGDRVATDLASRHPPRRGRSGPRRGHIRPPVEHRLPSRRSPRIGEIDRRHAAPPASRSGTSRRCRDTAHPAHAPNPLTPRTFRFQPGRRRRSSES